MAFLEYVEVRMDRLARNRVEGYIVDEGIHLLATYVDGDSEERTVAILLRKP